ncbi:hypothetical protein, partial [Streptomyces atratus]
TDGTFSLQDPDAQTRPQPIGLISTEKDWALIRALDFPAAGQHDEALGPFGPGDDAQGEPEAFAGPVDEVAGVAAVGPDLGDFAAG